VLLDSSIKINTPLISKTLLSHISVNISAMLHRDMHVPPENLIPLFKYMTGSIKLKKGKKHIFISVRLSD